MDIHFKALLNNFGIDLNTINSITDQIIYVFKKGIKISIVVGGGNMSYRHRYGSVGGWNIVIHDNSTNMYIRYDGAEDDTGTGNSTEMMKKEDWGANNKYFVFTATYITAS